MSFGDLGVVVLSAYFLGLVAVAEVAYRRRRDASLGDHFLASRELGFFVLFLTLYATAYSGNSLLGYPGRAYVSGFSFVMATGFMMSIIVVFHVLVPKLRPLAVEYDFITPGDWVRHRFVERDATATSAGSLLVLGVGVLMTFALGNFLLAQLKAMGEVTSLVTGGAIPYEAGVVGLAVLILYYESRGGMRAVAWTDAGQGILMLFGLAALLAWLLTSAGGLDEVTRSVAAVRPEAVAVPNARVCANWFSTIALLGLASVLYPQAIQRIYAARSGEVLRRSFALMTFMPLATTAVVTLIGIAAIARLDVGVGAASDGVMPLLLGQWASDGAWGTAGALLVFLGALAAIMSTADSCLLSLGSLVARDLLGLPAEQASTTLMGKWIAAGLLCAMALLALERDISLWRLIELKMELLIQCVPAFLLAIHWRAQRALPTLIGLVVGTLFSVILTQAGTTLLAGVHVGVVGFAINLAIALAGSALPTRVRGPVAQVL